MTDLHHLNDKVSHYWDQERNMAVYDFSRLTIEELRIEWIHCEQNKAFCHPESGFQRIIDGEMRAIVQEIKSRKKLAAASKR